MCNNAAPYRCILHVPCTASRCAMVAIEGAAAVHPWPLLQVHLPALLSCPKFPLPAAYALGFLNCDDISARCMLSIFQVCLVHLLLHS